MSKVLLVDDDRELGAMLVEYLALEGFEPHAVHTGENGVDETLAGDYDVVVLDVMLPGIGGIEALRRIRERSAVPVLMLTARGDQIDRIVGLELGADDYVPKPCPPRELVARLRAILRRSKSVGVEGPLAQLAAGELVIWPTRRRAEWQGTALSLTSTEFNLLEVLMRSAGRLVAKQDLYIKALGRPMTRFERSIDVHISSVRQKLHALAGDRCRIETVRGMGYQLVAG